MSGKFGNMVIRQRGDMTIIAKLPSKSKNKPTEAQENQKRKFRLASELAKYLLTDPKQRAKFERLAAKTRLTVYVYLVKYLLENNGKRLTEMGNKHFEQRINRSVKSKPKK